MTLLLGFASLAAIVIAIVLASRVPAGLAAVARVVRMPTTPLARAAAGPIEVAGVVRAEAEALTTLDGARAVALRTTVRPQRGTGKQTQVLPEIVVDRHVAARVEDGGATAAIDLEGAVLVGPSRAVLTPLQIERLDELLGREGAARVPAEATHLVVRQLAVLDGATVLVSGEAVPAGPRPGDDYRRAGTAFRLAGRPDRLLVVSVGTQAAFLARAIAPVALVVGAALGLATLGVANLVELWR